MHVVTILRYYLGLTQSELAARSSVGYADVNEIENKPNNGLIEKYRKLAGCLQVPVHAIVMNDILSVSETFFRQKRNVEYTDPPQTKNGRLGRLGEEWVFQQEQERLAQISPILSRLVVPKYKIRGSRGYDIISFKENGMPFFIEVKTGEVGNNSPQLTGCEFETANKLTNQGYEYWIYHCSEWDIKNQTFEKHLFRTLRDENRIEPVRYICDFRPSKNMENGILHFRKQMGISQIAAANMLKIPVSCLCKYETGENQCPVTAYEKMSNLYQVTIDELLGEYPVKNCG